MPSPTETSSVVATSLLGLETTDSLIHSYKWYTDNLIETFDLSFSFISSNSFFSTFNYDSDVDTDLLWSAVTDFNLSQKDALRDIISSWSNVSGISFIEVEESATTVGDIRLGLSSNVEKVVGDATAFAYLPDNFYPSAGDIWFNATANDLVGGLVTNTFANSNFEPGSLANHTAIHEVGHALGLKHPFESSNGSSTILSKNLDEISNTVMSYTYSANDDSVLGLISYPTTPMKFDIEAIEHLYGKNLSFNSGDTQYSFGDGKFYFETIYDSSGIDTIYYDGNYKLDLSLESGSANFIGKRVETYGDGSTGSEYAIANIYLSSNVEIENAVGSRADDIIKGNDLNNEITGGYGDDSLYGGSGNDILKGGPGSDKVYGGDGLDTYKVTSAHDQFVIQKQSEDTWLLNGDIDEGNDIITGIERISFNDVTIGDKVDQVLAFDTDAGDTAGQSYRLYQAAFARIPDNQGVAYHVNDMENNGLTLEQVANNFLASDEFKTKYGENPSDVEYINALYHNVLSRSPAEGEVSYYKNQFDTGLMTHAAALIGFAESPENIALVSPQIENGIMFF